MKRAIILFIATLTLFSCGKRLLQDYTDCPEQPLLFPDYTDITVPCNIAPLNFQLEGAANLSVIIQGKKEYQFPSLSSIYKVRRVTKIVTGPLIGLLSLLKVFCILSQLKQPHTENSSRSIRTSVF